MTLENLKYAYRDIMINPLKIIFFNYIYLGGIKTKLSLKMKSLLAEK